MASGQSGGTTALTLVGTVIGAFIGGPYGAMIGGMAGGLIGSLVFNRSAKPLIPDWQLAGAAYGHPRPIIFGTVRLPATYLWESSISVQRKSLSAKGLGGTTYSYYQSAALAFCDTTISGPVVLLKIWTDGNLFYDATATTPVELTKYKFGIRFYQGDEAQMPDFRIAEWVAANVIPGESCPAYRGTGYLVCDGVDLSHFLGRFPNISCLITNSYTSSTVFLHFQRLSPDVSADISIKAVAVDWVRLITYQFSNDGTLRSFNMTTGLSITAKTWADFWPNGIPIENGDAGPLFTGPLKPGTFATTPGGNLYMTNQPRLVFPVFTYSHCYLFTIDPNSLTIINSVIIENVIIALADFITELFPFSLTGVIAQAQGDPAFELVAGTWNYGPPFVISPAAAMLGDGVDEWTGESPAAVDPAALNPAQGTGPLPVAFAGLFAKNAIVLGNNDQITGTQDIWFISMDTSPFVEFPVVYLFRMQVSDRSCNPESFTLIATITPAMFGFPSATFFSFTIETAYSGGDDTLIMSCVGLGASIKFDPNASLVIWASLTQTINAQQTNYFNLDLGTVGSLSPFNLDTSSTTSGVQTAQPLPNVGQTLGYTWGYDSYSSAVLGSNLGLTDLYLFYIQRLQLSAYPVSQIITLVCNAAGLTDEQIDVDLVTQTVVGYSIMEAKSAGACISDVCNMFQIDMVESDYKLKFIPRGQAPVATITQDDLGSIDANDDGKFLTEKDAVEQEMPLQINARFVDPEMDYQANATYGKRTALPVATQFSRRIKTVDLPAVISATQARQIAESWLYTIWAERNTYATKLSLKHIYVDPTDNITVALTNGDTYNLRIEQEDIGADLSIQLSLASEDVTVYGPGTNAEPVVSTKPQVLIPTPFLNWLPFNVPLLQDTDDLGGTASRVYFSAGSMQVLSTSAVGFLYQSPDGSSWPLYATLPAFADWGQATNALGDTVSLYAVDYINTVRVRFQPGSALPSSCTYLEMMNGANPALLGNEVIQFMTVTENADGTATLSGLCRARRGTDYATGGHQVGDNFIMLLTDGSINANRLPLNDIGVSLFYRLVPGGRTPDEMPTRAFTYRGYDLMPYSPVQFEATPSGSDLVLTWLRRTRIGGGLMDGTDTVPLHEETEAYEVYIIASAAARATFDPTNSMTYVRKWTGITSPTVTYTAAEMTTDSFDPTTDTLYLIVYQLSAVVGRGFQGYQAIPAF